jgi:hypothetical protein
MCPASPSPWRLAAVNSKSTAADRAAAPAPRWTARRAGRRARPARPGIDLGPQRGARQCGDDCRDLIAELGELVGLARIARHRFGGAAANGETAPRACPTRALGNGREGIAVPTEPSDGAQLAAAKAMPASTTRQTRAGTAVMPMMEKPPIRRAARAAMSVETVAARRRTWSTMTVFTPL